MQTRGGMFQKRTYVERLLNLSASQGRILPRLKELTVERNPFEGLNVPRQQRGVHW